MAGFDQLSLRTLGGIVRNVIRRDGLADGFESIAEVSPGLGAATVVHHEFASRRSLSIRLFAESQILHLAN